MRFERANGAVLHYELGGRADAPALVFSNSIGTDLRVWDAVAERLGDRYRTLRYDKRGHGLSDATPAPYRIEDHVADLSELLDRLGVSGAVLVGLSVGGLIAQGLAAARPDLVRALVLCATAHRIGPPEMWDERIRAIQDGGIAALAEPILQRWFSGAFHREREIELAGWRNMLVRTSLDGYLGTCAAIRDADLTQAAAEIRVPTLCLCGTEDGATPPALVQSLADLIPGARFAPVEGAGHLPCVEKPAEVAELIGDFLEEIGYD